MELASLIDEKIVPLYRFAVLLTGDATAGEQALVDVCTECAPDVEKFRKESAGMTLLISKLRARCERWPAGNPADTIPVARRFHLLPEPERSALALFYLGIFPAREIAAMLKLSLEELSALLAQAREHLRAQPLTT